MKCSRCKEEKNLMEYYVSKGRHRNPCKECAKKSYHDIKHTDEYKERYLRAHLKRSYKISLEQRESMLIDQNNKCKICERTFNKKIKPYVDHCHTTEKVRGLLCCQCDLIIGQIKDNVKVALNIVNYLGVT